MHGPVLLITGASTGIGAATARLAAAYGYRLVLSARSPAPLRSLAEELGGPSRTVAVPCDVTDDAQVAALAERAAGAFGGVDAVFANAGVFASAPLLGGGAIPGEWREMVLTNVYGTAVTAHALWPLLAASRGHLVLTGSVAGRVTVPGSLYSATKWAVAALAASLRAAAVGSGVRVTAVHPGLVEAGGRSPGREAEPALAPGDVARAVLFALTQPEGVDVNELVVRPAGQDAAR
ncbi:NADP-dependent 3-hydroxy acid dehydrogenase YdfG [Sinosporangium album]|uniref:NADP-dependent 3-hydroxy acid dehydrogenase YdfG n=1 Tax=Sinosporangium album TaxID=504805 RepID=A0A1G8DJJ7_9ACTN|nr:SDR family NAD(P)-dependent oxidoreductase [Sinosporangium album]SDH57836.1 NADP-dependent 3-hydroxy acid dehydrogenase YdfG [Sinosporangium album]